METVNWNYFDAFCTVGRHCKLQEGGLHTADDLLAEMDHYGIAEALVVDSLARENHPEDGNRRILEVTASRPRLHPAWAALHGGADDEQPPPKDFLDQLRRHRVGAIFLFTGQYRINLSDWCVDALLEPLASAGVPVFLNPNAIGPGGDGQDVTDWDKVVALCRRWPKLPVIVSEFRIRQTQRMIYRAFDACPNLHVELSAWWLHHGVEYITRRWGGGRLLFGSNWPRIGQHMTMAPLACAEIPDADKRCIAGDNLRELLRWCGRSHPQVQPKPPADEFVAFGRTGVRPKDMIFDDCHGHLGGKAASYHLPDCDLEGIVREMERIGVRKTCVFSFAGVHSDEVFGNDYVAAAVAKHPDRFVGFTLVNPHRGRDAILRELERGAKLGLRGIKLIPYYQGYPDDGPLIDVPCQWAHERKQIILNHSWGPPAQVERLVRTYPDACFFTGHMTLAYADIMKRYKNLYVCSCPLIPPRACEQAVAAFGADRLLFGSDLQDLPIAWGLGPILFSRLPVDSKRMILGGNLNRILERYSLKP